ncbi:hypothetical protein [Rhizohabitans arisaemae]|nr:hypothetical protein [Rhizohabitans arisaemae]
MTQPHRSGPTSGPTEILALNVEDLDLDGHRAPIRSKGGAKEWVY